MLTLQYSTDFVRVFSKFESNFQAEVLARIEEFRNPKNHRRLAVHKLKGAMKGQWAFSIDYRNRIVFEYSNDKKTAYLLDIGDHSIYE